MTTRGKMVADIKKYGWVYLLQTVMICEAIYGGISGALMGEWNRVTLAIIGIGMTIIAGDWLKRFFD